MKEIVLPDEGGGGYDPDLEARLLALIMGEASPFEEEALAKLMDERPEVAVLKRRLEAVHGLVNQAVNSDDEGWKLSPRRRAQVVRALGIGNGGNGGNGRSVAGGGGEDRKEARIQRASRRVLWAAAACVLINVVLFAWLIGHLPVRKAELRASEQMTVTYSAEVPSEADDKGVEEPAGGFLYRPLEPSGPSRSNLTAGRGSGAGKKEREPAEESAADPFSAEPAGEGGGVGGGIVGSEPVRRQAGTEEAVPRDDPVRSNPALTAEDGEQVDQVRRNLYTAEGYKNLGLHDAAIEEYQRALRIDPQNSAARRGMERIQKLKSDYYRSAYDETRAALLAEVDETWERSVPPAKKGAPVKGDQLTDEGRPAVETKLKNIVIPEIDLEDTTLEDAIDFLRQRTRELDTYEVDPNRRGMNFVLRKPRVESEALTPDTELGAAGALSVADPSEIRIKNLKLKDVTVEQALDAIADQAGMRVKTDDFAVTMVPRGLGVAEDVITRRWNVGPGFLAGLAEAQAAGEEEVDPFGNEGNLGGAALRPRRPVSEMLKEMGIDFPPGASVQYLPESGELIVRNTPGNLDLVEQMTESLGPAEPPAPIDPELFRRRGDSGPAPSPEARAVEWKLKNIIIPAVDFDETTVEDAIDFLRQRSRELDSLEAGPQGGGLSFRLRRPEIEATSGPTDKDLEAAGALPVADPGEASVKELKLRNVPLATVLQYICDQAGLRYRIGDDGVEILPRGIGLGEDIVTQSWEVHPDVIEYVRDPGDEMDGGDNPFGSGELLSEREKAERRQAMMDRPLTEVLKECGIAFPPGASAQYLADTGVLVVSNTPANNDLVDQLFEMAARELSREEKDEELAEAALEVRAAQEPFSTFSLHVSDVSFKLAKATLAQGEWPAAGQIRVEEFVNAFDYGDPMPTREEKVACRVEQAAHPFMQQRNLLRISMRTAAAGRAGGVPLSLTVLLDHSGSMERHDRSASVGLAFDLLAEQLNENDRVTLISFARTTRLLADRIPGSEAATLSAKVAATPSGGGTNIEQALRLGLEKALEQKIEDGQNRVVLLTDGAANLGNSRPEDLAKVVERMRQRGVAFDACGVGAAGLNDEILESLTRQGDGRYYFLDRPEDADEGFARQIAGALRPAAKNVKVQVEFNPRRVDRYKLYGFEKHLLEKEDFRDDSVDAAELAAAEAGNAVYHVQVKPDGEGAIGAVSVRFLDVASGRMVERRWTIPYDATAPRLSEATPSMKLAGCAALLGEKLNGSELGERVLLSELAELVHSLQLDYPASERVWEFAEMTRRAREVE